MNYTQVKDRILELVGDKIGTAVNKGKTFPAIFFGTPDYDDWQFNGILVLIPQIPQGEVGAITGGALYPQDWMIKFVQYDTKQKTTILEIWEILKLSFSRVSAKHTPKDNKSKVLETLIVNIPNSCFYFID